MKKTKVKVSVLPLNGVADGKVTYGIMPTLSLDIPFTFVRGDDSFYDSFTRSIRTH